MACGELVTVEPNELLFETKLGSRPQSTLMLTNTSKKRVAFRVQTNNPSIYLVRPNCGFLDASQTMNISIELLDHRSFRTKDRFLISAALSADDEADRVQFWLSVPAPVHQRIKVGVQLPPSSTYIPKPDSKVDARQRSTGEATTTTTGALGVGNKKTPQEMQFPVLSEENEWLRHRDSHSDVRMRKLEERGCELEAENYMLRPQLDCARSVQPPADRHQHGALLGLFVAVALLVGIWLINYLAA